MCSPPTPCPLHSSSKVLLLTHSCSSNSSPSHNTPYFFPLQLRCWHDTHRKKLTTHVLMVGNVSLSSLFISNGNKVQVVELLAKYACVCWQFQTSWDKDNGRCAWAGRVSSAWPCLRLRLQISEVMQVELWADENKWKEDLTLVLSIVPKSWKIPPHVSRNCDTVWTQCVNIANKWAS